MLYYVFEKQSLFLYASTLSLYNIFTSCFSHLTIKDYLKRNKHNDSNVKILKYTATSIIIVSTLFILLSIIISDIMGGLLNIKNTFLPYLIMGLSIPTEPITKLLLEYLESFDRAKLSSSLLKLYHIIEYILLLVISIIAVKIIKLPIHISISLLYFSKIISFITLITIIYLNLKKTSILKKNTIEEPKNYKKEIKTILTHNSNKSIIKLFEKSYYYISIILLYMELSTKYSYAIDIVEHDLTFIYLYGITIITFAMDIIILLTKYQNKKENIINYICIVFKNMLTIAIISSITSPLICKIIFNSNANSIYFVALSFLSIFTALYNTTFDNIKNKKIKYTSLIAGIISKLILTIPLINSFYRIGYNLIYGDIASTIISMFISIAINYIYIKTNNSREKTLEKILTILYESILLCIILVLLQFIIPIRTDNYLNSIILLIIYISVSIIFTKCTKKKRG